jgi:hypothetical protein
LVQYKFYPAAEWHLNHQAADVSYQTPPGVVFKKAVKPQLLTEAAAQPWTQALQFYQLNFQNSSLGALKSGLI